MADLDVSDVLDDPDFYTDDLILVRRRVEAIEDGTSDSLRDPTRFRGVVIPDGGEGLIQTPEGDMVSGDITVFTRVALTSGDQGTAADLVVWDGRTHKVVSAKPYRFGAGFTQAICAVTEINPPAEYAVNAECEPDGGYLG